MHSGRPDEIDFKILQHLQEDARISLVKLASLVGLTIGPLSTRIEKLETAGFIKKYMTVLDREKISQPVLVILMIKLKEQNTKLLDEFEKVVIPMPEVQSCHVVSGSWNFIIQVTAKTPQDYAIWLFEKVNMHPNISSVESAFLMKEAKNHGPFLVSSS